MEIFFFLLFFLTVLAVIGHAIWVLVAWFFRTLFGSPPKADTAVCAGCGQRLAGWAVRCGICGLERGSRQATELAELAAMERHLEAFLLQEGMDRATHAEVQRCIDARRRRLLGRGVFLPVAETATAAPPERIVTPVWQRLDRLLADCHDPRSLPSAKQAQALSWHHALPPEELVRLTAPAQLALARLLETAGLRNEALGAYQRLLERHRASPQAAEAALEAACVAVQLERRHEAALLLEHALEHGPTPESRQEAAKLLDLYRASTPEAAIPETLPAEPPAPPAPPPPPPPPRRSLGEVLVAFMEERNIFWGELLGGLLVVGCSIALVISLWQTLDQIPYFPFLVFAALTGSLFGAGLYTLHHWKLESTSRGLLVIATLLVPLNLLVLAGLSKGRAGGFLDLAVEGAALGLFGAMVYRAGRTLLPGGQAALTLAVVGTSAGQLLTQRLLDPQQPLAWRIVLLALLPVACHSGGIGWLLDTTARRRPFGKAEAKGLLALLGTATFALAVTLGFLAHWTGDPTLALERIALGVALAGLPVLATGLLIERGLADEAGLAGWRTVGTAVALAGIFVLSLAVVLAWPQPLSLVVTCVFDFLVLTAVALYLGLPVAHAAALTCLVLGYLTGFHALTGRLDVPRHELQDVLLQALRAPVSGTALAAVVLLLGGLGEVLLRAARARDGVYYTVGSGVAALLSLVLVSNGGPDGALQAAGVYTLYGAGSLVQNRRWRRPAIDYAGLALLVCASLWGLHGRWATDLPLWATVLASEALVLSLLASWPGHPLRIACRDTALAVGLLALVLGVTAPAFPAAPLYAGAATALAAAAFLLAVQYDWPALVWAGSALALAALSHALVWDVATLQLPRPGLVALLLHATLCATAGLVAERRRATREEPWRLFAAPLLHAALVTSTAAVPLLLMIQTELLLPTAADAAWLAGLWLAVAVLRRWRPLFTAFQAVLALAVVLVACAWMERQTWFVAFLDALFDPRGILAVLNGLAGLGLAWALVRIPLRAQPAAQYLLEPPWPALDRLLTHLLVVAQAVLAVLAVAPDVVAELQTPGGPGLAWAERVHATGPAAWLLLGLLGLATLATLWERWRADVLTVLVLLTATVPVLVAGSFRDDLAAASALRWGLAAAFLACSVPMWFRTSLRRLGARLGCPDTDAWRLPAEARLLCELTTVGPTVALTIVLVALGLSNLAPAGPAAGSFFQRIGWSASAVTPLVLLTLGLAGHALRERSGGYAFAAGLGVNALASFLVWDRHFGQPLSAWWVPLLETNAAVSASLGLGWLWATAGTTRRPALLPVQAALGLLGSSVLLLWCLAWLLLDPSGPLPTAMLQAGEAGGWAALALALAAAIAFVHRTAPQRAVHAWVVAGLLVGIQAACTVSRWDQGNWLAHHTLTAAWSAAGLALLLVGWMGADLRLIGPHFWSRERRAASAEHLALLFPLGATRRWVEAVSVLVVALALRGTWADPARPYGSAGAVLAAAVLLGALALWSRRPGRVVASGLLLNLAGIVAWEAWLADTAGVAAWLPWGPGVVDTFLYTNILCFALGSAIWTALDLALGQRTRPEELRGRLLPYSHAAALLAVQLLAMLTLGGIASDLTAMGIHADGPLAWTALAATALALLLCLWDADAFFAPAALYVLGLLALGLGLHSGHLPPRDLGWTAALLLAPYALLASAAGWGVSRTERTWQVLRLAEPPGGWPRAWFPVAQVCVAGLATALGLWVSVAFASTGERLAGALALALLLPAGPLLQEAAPSRWGSRLRYGTLGLGVVLAVALGWALLDTAHPAVWLHRGIVVLAALTVLALVYRSALPRVAPEAWAACARQLGALLGICALVLLVGVLAHELTLFDRDPDVRRTPMAGWAIVTVAGCLVTLLASALTWAVTPARDPFFQSESGRHTYVYTAEVLLVLLFVHLRLTVPEIFPRFSGRYWPFVIMAVAYGGVGLGEWFRQRGLLVLAVPLRRTGLFLPVLPLIAFWARPSPELHALADSRLPGLRPLLEYLDRLPQHFGDHALLWTLVSGLFAYVAVAGRSFRHALAAALAANFGLWALLYHRHLGILVHPQLWLIPLALIILVSEQINRARLSHAQARALRYAGLLLLYLSSTADLFLSGLGSSVLLPVVLALLSVGGVLAGILLRVRAFLLMGFTFLVLDIVSMIYHAAVDRYQTWLWWLSGIVLGAVILTLFGIFEKRRNEVLRLLEEVKRWD